MLKFWGVLIFLCFQESGAARAAGCALPASRKGFAAGVRFGSFPFEPLHLNLSDKEFDSAKYNANEIKGKDLQGTDVYRGAFLDMSLWQNGYRIFVPFELDGAEAFDSIGLVQATGRTPRQFLSASSGVGAEFCVSLFKISVSALLQHQRYSLLTASLSKTAPVVAGQIFYSPEIALWGLRSFLELRGEFASPPGGYSYNNSDRVVEFTAPDETTARIQGASHGSVWGYGGGVSFGIATISPLRGLNLRVGFDFQYHAWTYQKFFKYELKSGSRAEDGMERMTSMGLVVGNSSD